MKYTLGFLLCIIIFSSAVSFGTDVCLSQGYEECPEGQHFDDECECVLDGGTAPSWGSSQGQQNQGQQNQGQGTTPPAGAQCESPSITAIGGVCDPGYKTGNNNCCVLICPGDNSYRTGGEPVETNCKPCEEDGMIPNENHTKCICNPNEKCCGIQLNTVVPFIGDCIELNTDSHRGDTTAVTSITAFPLLMQGLMKILMSAIMVFSFLMVIIAGLMMTTGAFSNSSFSKGKNILKNVIISLILLGCSGLILSLINPSFFGG